MSIHVKVDIRQRRQEQGSEGMRWRIKLWITGKEAMILGSLWEILSPLTRSQQLQVSSNSHFTYEETEEIQTSEVLWLKTPSLRMLQAELV